VLVIVVRYFGGTLLGTTGLIQAYKESTMEAFQNANIIEKTVCDHYRCTFDYIIMADVMNAIKKLELEISKKDFSESAFIEVAIPIDKTNATFLQFKALILKKTLEEVKSIEHIGGIRWDYLFTL
jgi:putative IMPACT (imprinted ancient) family translation regulator